MHYFALFCAYNCFNLFSTREYLDFGECTEELQGYETQCMEKVKDEWDIKGELNSTNLSSKQLCCARWDYMFCIIKNSRDICTEEELEFIIENSIDKQNQLEESDCYDYTRDAYFVCHFYWYYYVISIVGFICILVIIIMVTAEKFKYSRPKKFQIIGVEV